MFVEVDRGSVEDKELEDSEVSLYSLKLQNTYNILEHQYQLIATINLNLGRKTTKHGNFKLIHSIKILPDYSEGGHYGVNVFVGEDEVVKIHEDSIERCQLFPASDHSVIVVLLKRIHSSDRASSPQG